MSDIVPPSTDETSPFASGPLSTRSTPSHRPAQERREPALGRAPRGRHARRPRRQGCDGRLGDRHARRGRARGGRRGHRLRHGRRRDEPDQPPTCPTTSAGCAPRSSEPSRSARGAPPRDAAWEHAGHELRGAGRGPDGGLRRAGRRRCIASAARSACQLGTLGGGNHFIEVCLDTDDDVWLMLHSGSRDIGAALAEHHMAVARRLYHNQALEDPRPGGVPGRHARVRCVPPRSVLGAGVRPPEPRSDARTCCKSVMRRVLAARRLRPGDLLPPQLRGRRAPLRRRAARDPQGRDPRRRGRARHHPGLDGHQVLHRARLGNPVSFQLRLPRRRPPHEPHQAKPRFTLADLRDQTEGVECRKDHGVIDEAPKAYKDIDKVMEQQRDLVEVVAELKQVLCVKG